MKKIILAAMMSVVSMSAFAGKGKCPYERSTVGRYDKSTNAMKIASNTLGDTSNQRNIGIKVKGQN